MLSLLFFITYLMFLFNYYFIHHYECMWFILIECFDFKCVYTCCIDYIIFHILSFQFSSTVNFFIPMSLKKI